LRRKEGLGLGSFLLGIGVGWLVFSNLDISVNVFAWLLILAGAGVAVSSLLSWGRPGWNIGGIVSGLMGGLIVSLFLTSGFGFITDISSGVASGPYRAEDTKSFTGTAAEDRIYLEVDNFNGPIKVSTWAKAEFGVNLRIRAKGTSRKNAEENLDKLKINFDESAVQGQKRLILGYDVPLTDRSKYSIEVEAFLPAQAEVDLDLQSSNGGIQLSDIDGGHLKMRTSNGELAFDDVFAEIIDGETSNGRVHGDLEAPDTSLSTSNGEIDLAIHCTVTGEYDLSASNGAVDITVSSSPEVGYDLVLSTSNANIEIDLPDLDYSQNQRTRKEARTSDFESKAVKVTIVAGTSNGAVDIDA